MLYGDEALTIVPVVNGAGESEIVASSTPLVADAQKEIDRAIADYANGVVTVDFGLSLSKIVDIPQPQLLNAASTEIAVGTPIFDEQDDQIIKFSVLDVPSLSPVNIKSVLKILYFAREVRSAMLSLDH